MCNIIRGWGEKNKLSFVCEGRKKQMFLHVLCTVRFVLQTRDALLIGSNPKPSVKMSVYELNVTVINV